MKILFFVVGLLFPWLLFSQSYIPKKNTFYSGSIILLSNDTLNGFIFFTTPWKMQKEIDFCKDPESGKSIEKISPNEIISFSFNDLIYKSVPFSGKYSMKKKSFMQQVVEGEMCLFKWYFIEKQQYFEENSIYNTDEASTEIPDYEIQYFLRNANQEFIDLSSSKYEMRFRKQMSGVLKNCQNVALAVKKGEKGYLNNDIEKIINEYNECIKRK